MNTGFHFEPEAPRFAVDMREFVVLLALLAAAVAVEIFLARKEDWRIGLPLPAAMLAWWLIQFVVRLVRWHPRMDELFLALAVENIPTLILLAVYALGRFLRRRRTARQLKRTRIEDI